MPRSPKFSGHLGYLFTELPFEDRFAAAREAGFAAIEHPAPFALPASEVARRLDDAGLPYAQFALKSGDPSKGEKGIAIFPERRQEFRSSIAEGLAYAEKIGVTMVHAMAGNLSAEKRTPAHFETYCDNLLFTANAAQERGVRLLLEAFSPGTLPDYYLSSATRAVEIIREIGHPNLGLLLDVFHARSVGEEPEALIRSNPDLIAHIHIADFPGRHEPGTGYIDFSSVMRSLQSIAFQGYIGCEYIPMGRTDEGLGWMTADWAAGKS